MDTTKKRLIQLVLDKTNSGLLTWSRGSMANEYKTELASAALHISYGIYDGLSDVGPTQVISVHMYNGTGAPITLVSENDTHPEFEMLYKLYNAAQDSCTRESETIVNLMEELNALGK